MRRPFHQSRPPVLYPSSTRPLAAGAAAHVCGAARDRRDGAVQAPDDLRLGPAPPPRAGGTAGPARRGRHPAQFLLLAQPAPRPAVVGLRRGAGLVGVISQFTPNGTAPA